MAMPCSVLFSVFGAGIVLMGFPMGGVWLLQIPDQTS